MNKTKRQLTAEIKKIDKWIKARRKADKNLKLGRKMYKLFQENVDNCKDDKGYNSEDYEQLCR